MDNPVDPPCGNDHGYYYSPVYLVSTLAFYAPVAAEEISSTAINGTWQLVHFPCRDAGLHSGPLANRLTGGTWPGSHPSACGKSPFAFADYYPIVYALLISIAASFLFRKGLNYYVKQGSTDMYPTDSAVSINNVTKTFIQWQRDNTKKGLIRNLIKPEKRKIVALDNVSFEVKKGEFVAYAGPNGAGKSTTMKLLAGMLLPNSGYISVLSLSPQKQRRLLMQRIGVLFCNRTDCGGITGNPKL